MQSWLACYGSTWKITRCGFHFLPFLFFVNIVRKTEFFKLHFVFCDITPKRRKLHPSSSAPQITPWQTSEAIVKRLHPPSPEAMAGQASKSSLRLGEDVPASLHYAVARKKRLRLLSEELLLAQKREEKTCGDLRHFFAKKMAAGNFYLHPPFWKAFWGRNFRILLWNEFLKIASLLFRKTQNYCDIYDVLFFGCVLNIDWFFKFSIIFLN